MWTFFKGWRRKTGCVTLVMALVLGVAWGRSQFIDDEVTVTFMSRIHVCKSTYGVLALRTWHSGLIPDSFESEVKSLRHHDSTGFLVFTNHMPDTTTFYFWTDESTLFGAVSTLIVPHWAITLALTLLSAYLLLWKPRQKERPDA